MKFEHFVTWRRIIIWIFEEIWSSGDFLCYMTEHGRNSRDTKSDLFNIRSISVWLLSCDLTWYMDCLRHHNHLLDHCQMRLLSSSRMLLNFLHLNKFTSANKLVCYRVLLKTRPHPNFSFLYEWWGLGVHVFLSIIRRPGSDIHYRLHDMTDSHIKVFNYRSSGIFPMLYWYASGVCCKLNRNFRSGRRSYLRNHNLR